MNRQTLWVVLMLATVVTVAGLNGCDGCSGNPRLHEISVTITTAPPATIAPNGTASIAATVANDRANAGVDWTCTPGNSLATCGSFSSTQTASGATTTYTAPPTAVGAVTITATSVTDASATANASVTIASGIVVTISTPPPSAMETSQTATIAATVTGDSQNQGVTWSCTPGNSASTCGAFSASPTLSGVVLTYTAPTSVPGGSVTITATSVSDTTKSASFTVTTVLAPNPETFTFYLSGLENINISTALPNFYSLAGAVTIDLTNGSVTGGEQDYNDAFGLTSPQPSGDTITGGTLTINSNGQGTLSLITNNGTIGVGGTETLGVQFVNNKHALITQYDSSATSSGSMDFQTIPDSVGGNFAFEFSGVDPNYESFAAAGVFNLSGTVLSSGIIDVNDDGDVSTGNVYAAVVTAPDAFGRGTITPNIGPVTINYYITGPEVIRLIDVDTTDSAVGSAFGQGTGTFTNASLGSSVFGIGSNSFGIGASFDGNFYNAVGQFSTSNTGSAPADFSGIGDDNEVFGSLENAAPISGEYNIPANGYGAMIFFGSCLQDVCGFGVYMVDPALNINDPNNTSTNLGGALLLDYDDTLIGSGFLVPQTDTAAASFSGNYAFGAQNITFPNEIADLPGWEFDFIGQGDFTPAVSNAPGLLTDPFNIFETDDAQIPATFSMTPTADGENAGRYEPEPFAISPAPAALPTPFGIPTVLYQANGGLLVWAGENYETNPDDDFLTSGGSLEQQTLPITVPAVPPPPQPSVKVTPKGTTPKK
jgi:hypothetical protein